VWAVLDRREGERDTAPEVLELAVGKAGSPGLDEDVADGSGFDRSGKHGPPGPVGDELAQESVLAGAADQVDHADRLSTEPFDVIEGLGVGNGEALEDASYRLGLIRFVESFRRE
jgi:hypothetical protein